VASLQAKHSRNCAQGRAWTSFRTCPGWLYVSTGTPVKVDICPDVVSALS